MNIPAHIDLHMHSTASDGTDSPEEILEKVGRSGIDLFALTDHDTVKGCAIVQEALKDTSPRFIPGVEFSCRDEGGKYHILGYGFDPGSEDILNTIEAGHAIRIHKLGKRLDLLKRQFGIGFSREEVDSLYAKNTPGKPHIAKLMILNGYVSSIDEAFDRYLEKLDVPDENLRPEAAIAGILAGGGIPVLAHPSYGDGDQLIMGEAMEERLLHLLPMGLMGLEGYYSGFTEKMQEEILGFARKYDLYVTAGSDYHGTNKLVRLGETGLEEVSDGADGLKRFLEKITG